MKKSLLLILALPLLLSSCEFSPAQDSGNNAGENTNENNNNPDNQNIENEDEEKEESGGNTDSGNNTETGGNTGTDEHGYIGENEENHQENSNISLDEWQEYEFHNGHKPQYNSDWLFFYGDSQEPRGSLWENPNEEVDYSGIEFQEKKQYLISPNFNSYPKVEVRFEFWFSAHTSSKYKAADNEPQFLIQEYDASDKLINTDSIEIERSDVPKNNTPLKRTKYITQSSMTHFKLRFNNFIPNGSSGYTAIVCKISLKGWPQV